MEWEKFERSEIGEILASSSTGQQKCPFQMGSVVTGKQRVFHRICIKLILPNGETVEGRDQHSVRGALYALQAKLSSRGITLVAAGLAPEFYETGLSFNSGYGYLSGFEAAIHMMDTPPPLTRDEEGDLYVEGLIREAVDGMFGPAASNVERPALR